ncbi:uncharacterized protein LAESUDRAFT_761216 [Laetiporus sulphureus 93-53]|uniref:Uncharacterized protein n=1 Tax=Laetiporus sulphureus 93-53 TaxID=1314785 RepID=A0A165D9M1_9APHY|nr:uncharacterized protein LAESUDRAFT_761216 [Laetiporus sulphureus 93-53]KZT04388.1 hypothetical protein LAESUDRAFT_761216 [Laetiporus sulphureus 93-53]
MVFGFLKKIKKAFKKKLPYILVIVQPHPELSEAICGHQATPFHYDIVTLENTQINTDESDDGPSFYCMIGGEDVKIHLPPFEILRQLEKEQTLVDAVILDYKMRTGMVQQEDIDEMSEAEPGIISDSEWGTIDTDTPSAEWEHGYGGYLCDSGWPNSQWESTSRVASSSSSEFPMRTMNGRNSEQHDCHEDVLEGGRRNLAIASQLSSSSLVQVPTMLSRNNEPDRIDFELLELAMESLVRLQELLDEASEGEMKDIYADVLGAEGNGVAN